MCVRTTCCHYNLNSSKIVEKYVYKCGVFNKILYSFNAGVQCSRMDNVVPTRERDERYIVQQVVLRSTPFELLVGTFFILHAITEAIN